MLLPTSCITNSNWHSKKNMSSVTLTRSLPFSNSFTGSLVLNVSNSKIASSLFPCLPQFTSSNNNSLIYLRSFPFILWMPYILLSFLLVSSLKWVSAATILLIIRVTHSQSLETSCIYYTLLFFFTFRL